jgi:hypothetical protein
VRSLANDVRGNLSVADRRVSSMQPTPISFSTIKAWPPFVRVATFGSFTEGSSYRCSIGHQVLGSSESSHSTICVRSMGSAHG